MNKPRRRKIAGRKDEARSFAGIPRKVMDTDSFKKIGPNASRVLLWMAYQFKGYNNGYLSATRTQAKSWGISGTDTLQAALGQLVKNRLILLTRQGRFTNPGGTPNLYALQWEPIDERAGDPLDVDPTSLPPRKDWVPVQNRLLCPVLEPVAPISGQSKVGNGEQMSSV